MGEVPQAVHLARDELGIICTRRRRLCVFAESVRGDRGDRSNAGEKMGPGWTCMRDAMERWGSEMGRSASNGRCAAPRYCIYETNPRL